MLERPFYNLLDLLLNAFVAADLIPIDLRDVHNYVLNARGLLTLYS